MTLPRPARTAATLVAVVALVLAAACSDGADTGGGGTQPAALAGATSTSSTPGDGDGATKGVEPGTYAVGRLHDVLVDPSRPTPPGGSYEGAPDRTLDTIALYPIDGEPDPGVSEADAEPRTGRYPLVVFSHGLGGNHDAYEATLRALASAGYVVVATNYPRSWTGAPGGAGPGDVERQTGDVSFLIDRLADGQAFDGALTDTVDLDRVGLAGHSLGAITSLGAGYNLCCADVRVDAVAEWAGLWFPLSSGGKADPDATDTPLLIVHGEKDETVPYATARTAWNVARGPRLWVTLPGEGHVPAFVQGRSSPAAEVAIDATVDFFDSYLKEDPAGLDRIRDEVDGAGEDVATLQEAGTG